MIARAATGRYGQTANQRRRQVGSLAKQQNRMLCSGNASSLRLPGLPSAGDVQLHTTSSCTWRADRNVGLIHAQLSITWLCWKNMMSMVQVIRGQKKQCVSAYGQ